MATPRRQLAQPPARAQRRSPMGLLDRAVSQGTAQYVIYACLAAPAFAFGLRMYNARNEYNRCARW